MNDPQVIQALGQLQLVDGGFVVEVYVDGEHVCTAIRPLRDGNMGFDAPTCLTDGEGYRAVKCMLVRRPEAPR